MHCSGDRTPHHHQHPHHRYHHHHNHHHHKHHYHIISFYFKDVSVCQGGWISSRTSEEQNATKSKDTIHLLESPIPTSPPPLPEKNTKNAKHAKNMFCLLYFIRDPLVANEPDFCVFSDLLNYSEIHFLTQTRRKDFEYHGYIQNQH